MELVDSDNCLISECAVSVSRVMLNSSLTTGSLSLVTSKPFTVVSTYLGLPQLEPNLGCNKVVVTANVYMAHCSHVLKRVSPFAVNHNVANLTFGVSIWWCPGQFVDGFVSKETAAYDKIILPAHADEPFTVVCEVTHCMLTHHSSPFVVWLPHSCVVVPHQ